MTGQFDYRRQDTLLLSRIRLAAISLLATVEEADFSFLREQIGASDGNLGAHMQKLAQAGYVEEEKSFHQRKPRTSYRLTPAGRQALEAHLDMLQAMLKGHGQ
ncbi:MAG: transcriptional regulator [Wenzhouxiangella sp.]|nr:transcriptional regulator [Wenzhouxiangella sp.]MCH8478741.1 transcriptional regulator [Wenzhouxiangella sp.]